MNAKEAIEMGTYVNVLNGSKAYKTCKDFLETSKSIYLPNVFVHSA